MNVMVTISMVAGSAALYHFASKNLATVSGINPWGALAFTYLLSFAITGLLALFWQEGSQSVRSPDYWSALPSALLLGLACVGIEGGYLLAYRCGSQITQLTALTSFCSTLAVLSVGFFFFKESVSVSGFLGLVLVVGGVGLMHWR